MLTQEQMSAIDQEIAELYMEAFKWDGYLNSYVKRLYKKYIGPRRSSRESDIQILNRLEEIGVSERDKDQLEYAWRYYNKVQEYLGKYQEAQSKYEGWSRFYIVPGGHIHNSMGCSTCNKGGIATQFGWLPEISGLTEEEAVNKHGKILCSVCFPSAPVEWTMGEEEDDVCPGSGTMKFENGYRYGYASGNGGTCSYCGKFVGLKSKMDHGMRKHRVPK